MVSASGLADHVAARHVRSIGRPGIPRSILRDFCFPKVPVPSDQEFTNRPGPVSAAQNASGTVNECFGLKATVEQGSIVRKGHDSARRREACSNQAFAASLSCISHMTIVKTSTSYFACTSPAITAATLSSIWFQPSI